MNNSFFSKFTPKEPKFFPLLKGLAEVSDNIAKQLIVCVENNDPDMLKGIKDLEHQGDDIISKVYYELSSTFITPFDREDISALANRLDDVTDQIYGCAKRITFYKPKEMPQAARELTLMIKEGTELVLKAVTGLEKIKNNEATLEDCCNKLHIIEGQADEIYQNFTIDLFNNYNDAIEIIKLKEILSVLEDITDEIDHVGKTIKTIMVKYA